MRLIYSGMTESWRALSRDFERVEAMPEGVEKEKCLQSLEDKTHQLTTDCITTMMRQWERPPILLVEEPKIKNIKITY